MLITLGAWDDRSVEGVVHDYNSPGHLSTG